MATTDNAEPTVEYDDAAAARASQLVRRDFAGVATQQQNGAIDALIAKERAMIEARWTMAMHRPRNLDNTRQEILKECRRPGFADVAVYARPVGRKKNEQTGEWEQQYVEGLSIRFAEVAVRCMRNLTSDTQTIHDSDGERLVRVMITDLETNSTWSRDLTVKKTVERRFLKQDQRSLGHRVNSYGDRVYIVEATDDEVGVKEAAAISKAARTLILRLIPGHIQDESLALCKQIAADRDAKDPAAARNRIFDAFGGIGVKPSDLEMFLGHSTESISPGELEKLRKLYPAIHDGEVSWQDALESALASREPAKDAAAPAAAPAKNKGTAAAKDAIKKNDKKPDAKPAEAPAPAAVEVKPALPDGMIDHCSKCGVEIEVGPKGSQCYACSQS